MLHRFLFLAPLVCCLSALAAEPGMARLKPMPARALPALEKLAGREPRQLAAALDKARGRPVIVNFWASWCDPCRQEMPALQALAARNKGLTVILVAVNDRKDDATDFLWENAITLPALTDREQTISQAWGARVLPTTLLLDARHRPRYRAVGPVDWESEPARDIIDKLTNSKR